MQEYVEHDRTAADLRTLVKLVDTYGSEAIIQAVDRLAPHGQGRVVVSTVHKAKGREWARVRIGPGFHPPAADHNDVPQPIRPDEARLAYVAVTRASDTLDMEGLSWLDEHEQQLAALADDSGKLTAHLIALPLTRQLAYPGAPSPGSWRVTCPASRPCGTTTCGGWQTCPRPCSRWMPAPRTGRASGM